MEPDVLLGLRKACDANAYDGCVATLVRAHGKPCMTEIHLHY